MNTKIYTLYRWMLDERMTVEAVTGGHVMIAYYEGEKQLHGNLTGDIGRVSEYFRKYAVNR